MLNPLALVLANFRTATTRFASAGAMIAMDYSRPTGRGPHPAVMLLHGSNGASSRAYFRLIMAGLVQRGYAALFPHYFERTGNDDLGDGTARDEQITRSFLLWQETILDALNASAQISKIDPARIALLGVSLGSYLALAAGADRASVRCIIEFCGGLPENLKQGFRAMPPVLIIHGEADPIVPVARAHELDEALSARDVDHELVIYPGQGHVLKGAAEMDAIRRCEEFLARHLQRNPFSE